MVVVWWWVGGSMVGLSGHCRVLVRGLVRWSRLGGGCGEECSKGGTSCWSVGGDEVGYVRFYSRASC